MVGPLTRYRDGSREKYEPYLAHERDGFSLKKLDSFFNRSYIELPLIGICISLAGRGIVLLNSALVDLMRIATFGATTPIAIEKVGSGFHVVGAILVAKGLFNLLNRYQKVE